MLSQSTKKSLPVPQASALSLVISVSGFLVYEVKMLGQSILKQYVWQHIPVITALERYRRKKRKKEKKKGISRRIRVQGQSQTHSEFEASLVT